MLWHAIRFDPIMPTGAIMSTGQQELELLATRAMRFTSSVCLAPPCSLLLETGASLRYFDGLDSLEQQIRREFQHSAPHTEPFAFISLSAAPTPKAALMFAAWRDGIRCTTSDRLVGQLGRLPVRLLQSAAQQIETLESAGLRRIAGLLELPRPAIARRFGQALLDELDEALGRRADPRPRHVPAPRFAQRLELPASIESAPMLGHAAGLLVERLCQWLQASRRAARSVILTISHDDHPDTVLRLGMATPAWEPRRLTAVLDEHLRQTVLAAPAVRLSLSCTEIDVAPVDNRSLFPDPPGLIEAIAPLLERLQARLGPGQIRQLSPYPDHRPEAAFRFRVADLARFLRKNPGRSAHHPADFVPGLPRPLWLLASPQALVERQGRPCRDGPLNLLAGPERIETGWWDGKPVQRDYFVAEDSEHRLLWIYRERLRNETAGGWFLHGCFG